MKKHEWHSKIATIENQLEYIKKELEKISDDTDFDSYWNPIIPDCLKRILQETTDML